MVTMDSRVFPFRVPVVLLVVGLLLPAVACRPPQPAVVVPPPAPADHPAAPEPTPQGTVVILSINDVYRIEGVDGESEGGLARVRTLRRSLEEQTPDLLLLHAGDLLFPSLLSRQLLGEQMIDVLNRLDGHPGLLDERFFATFGNHELDKKKRKDAAMLDARIEASEFTWLDTNIRWATDENGADLVASKRLAPSAVVESNGVSVGIFSLSTDLEHPEYVVDFGDLETVARRSVAELRDRGAELVVALTHLPIGEDLDLLKALGDDGPDLVVGGHEHNRLCRALDDSGRTQVCDQGGLLPERPVIKADAEARTAAVIRVRTRAHEPPKIFLEYRELGPEVEEDGAVRAVVDDWLARHEAQYCFENLDQPPGCLEEVVGRTRVRLEGEELRIRRFESNLGNFIADQALAEYRRAGAVAAFINAGSIRLNQDIPADSDITLRHVEEIFQFPSYLEVLKIRGSVLQQVIEHAVTDWTGNGRFLQIAGFAYRHDPERATADRLTLMTVDGPRPVDPEEELLVVTSNYLASPATGQDGYTMLTKDMWVATETETVVKTEAATLKDLTLAALQAAGADGIAPEVEGRICTVGYPGPCLAEPR